MNTAALNHLSNVDPILRNLIDRVGPCRLRPERRRAPYQSLVRAVAHQQLNGKAARTILSRFIALCPESAFPTPADVQQLPIERLTAVGFSRAKAGYIKAIAQGALDGTLPATRSIARWSDEDIVERLTQIRGVGRWTVEMYLMFTLGRPDVLPVHDFGIRNGFAIVYRKRVLPKPADLLRHGERWRPYRTTASWYLWRAVDLARSAER
jgi:DNA-3-methyladenine glycosylase II